jgi:hypothetical protein
MYNLNQNKSQYRELHIDRVDSFVPKRMNKGAGLASPFRASSNLMTSERLGVSRTTSVNYYSDTSTIHRWRTDSGI